MPERITPELVAEVNRKVAEAYAELGWVHPVGAVRWVRIEHVHSNTYNPNSTAHQEMGLLHTSIKQDGFTMPVVTILDAELSTDEEPYFTIVDGFHRHYTMKSHEDIYNTTGGWLPIVVIDKPVADLMASTVRHNRARGKHSVSGMGNLVFEMLMAGESDGDILTKLGMEPEELARLKHVTGYSKLFADQEHTKLSLAAVQIDAKAAYKREHPDEHIPAV